jgi:hypothetical protein
MKQMCRKKCKKDVENAKNISITLWSSKFTSMVPFNLQLEINERLLTISVEQLDQFADNVWFMRYQVRTFNHNTVVFVNIEGEQLSPEDIIGFSEDDVFTLDEVKVIAAAIRRYNDGRKLKFDQMTFNF